MILTDPCVFAAGNNYVIFVPVKKHSVMYIKIGNKCYYDHSNGVLRSLSLVHKITVPANALDKAKKYTVAEQEINGKRRAYFNKLHAVKEYTYDFYPVPEKDVRAYFISDTHNRVKEPVAAANAFGKFDFLILNGDIPNSSSDIKYFKSIYEITSQLTHGNIPAVFVRGNHDLRGVCAEIFSDYIPTVNGNTYFTFKLGNIKGIALDCGEDKSDSHAEYGGTICCHAFRDEETDFLKNIAQSDFFNDENTLKKLVICHNPFTMKYEGDFDIENEIFSEWADILKTKIKPDLMLCGHLHRTGIHYVGGELDNLGQPCTMIVAAKPYENGFVGCGFDFKKDKTLVTFTDSNGKCEKTQEII